MASYYTRSKLGFHSISRYYFTSKTLIPPPISTINRNNNSSKFTSSPISQLGFRLSGAGYRNYYVDSRQIRHFKPRGFENPRNNLSKFTSFTISQFKPVTIDRSSLGFRLFGTGYRNYYVDSRQIRHFKPRGFKQWFENPRNVMIVVVVGSGIGVTVYFGNVETIPYTKRKHLVLLSKNMEKMLGESQFQNMKAGFKGKIWFDFDF